MLNIPRSDYHEYLRRKTSKRDLKNGLLRTGIWGILEHKGWYVLYLKNYKDSLEEGN